MTQTRGPGPEVIEVSLFGRGFGESALFHVGDNRWILIDSFVERDGRPSALRYLSEIGVEPGAALKLIVATHWHDDHVRGLSTAYACARDDVALAMPHAMQYREVAAFFGRVRQGGSERLSSGVAELDRIAAIRKCEGRSPLKLAKANEVLLRYKSDELSHRLPVSVEALSPSEEDGQAFLEAISASPPLPPGNRTMPFEPNQVSIALWVSIGRHRVLLGADLENTTSVHRGWQAVLNSSAPVDGRADVIKVPHHGSANAHHQPVWDRLLSSPPIAMLTTYNKSSKLPTDDDIRRINALTPEAYITSRTTDRRSDRRPAAVERTLAEAGAKVRTIHPRSGQIRARLDLTAPAHNWHVDLFDNACHLGEIRDHEH